MDSVVGQERRSVHKNITPDILDQTIGLFKYIVSDYIQK